MKLVCFISMIIFSLNLNAQSIVSIGGGVGYTHCFYLNKSENSKFSNPEFLTNFNLYLFTENVFYIGLQVNNQLKGIRVNAEDYKASTLYDFTITENRIGLIGGVKVNENILPFVSMNFSNYVNEGFGYHNNNYYVPDNFFSKFNPSIELGCNFITANYQEKKASLINRFSIRYTPLSMFNNGNFVNYLNENSHLITTPNYNKMLDVTYSMSIQYNKHFKQ